MTTFLLIRHGTSDVTGGTIAGRGSGHHLNATGRAEVGRLSRWLEDVPIDACVTSPLERTRETAWAICQRRGIPVRTDDGLLELDFGQWTGRTIESLRDEPEWHRFNTERAVTRIPGGELMGDVVNRSRRVLERLRDEIPDGVVAVVSHGDVIRGLVAHYLAMPLDAMLRLEIEVASVSVLSLRPGEVHLRALNCRAVNAERMHLERGR